MRPAPPPAAWEHTRRLLLHAYLVLLALGAGCSKEEEPSPSEAWRPDAASPHDAGPADDASLLDAGADAAHDGGDELPLDANLDAGLDAALDANRDAAPPDAALADAALDGNLPDAQPSSEGWVTSWANALADQGLLALFQPLDDSTVRQRVHTSLAGTQLRVRISNQYGERPLRLGKVRVALAGSGSAIVPDTDRGLTFAGAQSVEIPAGKTRTSDPLELDVPALSDLAISMEISGAASAHTYHAEALQTSYVADGALASAASLPGARKLTMRVFLEAIDVKPRAGQAPHALVCFGDSITDGSSSTTDANRRYPDVLARRLAQSPTALAVVNEGYGGNMLLADGNSPAGLARFDRDVLGQVGVTHLLVLEGINDIGLESVDSRQLIDGMGKLIERAHAAGLKVLGGTLCPFAGSFYWTRQGEQTRAAFNEWIRHEAPFDGVVDFDEATRDPARPDRFLPAYDSGDHLHPNDQGYEAMAAAVDLGLLH